ncbi:hypothetical protein B296_00021996, partial [Ensete ventricosum]
LPLSDTTMVLKQYLWSFFIPNICRKLSKRRGEQDLAGDGAVGVEPGIAEGDEIEVDDGDQPVAEYLGEVVHDEAGTEGAQRLVVQRHRDLPTGNSNGRGEDMAEEEEEEEEEAGVPSHWEKDKTVLLAREVALLVATAGIPRFSLRRVWTIDGVFFCLLFLFLFSSLSVFSLSLSLGMQSTG